MHFCVAEQVTLRAVQVKLSLLNECYLYSPPIELQASSVTQATFIMLALHKVEDLNSLSRLLVVRCLSKQLSAFVTF